MNRIICRVWSWSHQLRGDRGDVPGWVLVTVMTAGLVTAIWVVADDQLRSIFSSALGRVTGP
jgi:hypothetical protein